MLNTWLNTAQRNNAGFPFDVFDVQERPVKREDLITVLAAELRIARKDPAYLQRIAVRYGLAQLRDYLAKKVFPDKVSVRNGDFGEVLAAALLRVRDGLYLPIFKLRFREKQNWPMRLADILAFERDENKNISAVWYGEVKTRTTKDLKAGCEGHQSLAKECADERPEILTFVVDRLFEQGRYDEANALDKFLYDDYDKIPKNHRIALLFDLDKWSEEVLGRLGDLPPTLPNLQVEVILVGELAKLIDDCYQCATEACDATA